MIDEQHVQRFLADHINSVEQLQVLTLLSRDPDREWTLNEIAQELRSSEGSIATRLDDLYERNVLVRNKADPTRHRFSPPSHEVSAMITELVNLYKQRPYRVIEAIYEAPNQALRAFANAFKFKKDGKK